MSHTVVVAYLINIHHVSTALKKLVQLIMISGGFGFKSLHHLGIMLVDQFFQKE